MVSGRAGIGEDKAAFSPSQSLAAAPANIGAPNTQPETAPAMMPDSSVPTLQESF